MPLEPDHIVNSVPWFAVGYAAVHYVVFRLVIRRLDLATPGRERED